jgi:hypothetical protein
MGTDFTYRDLDTLVEISRWTEAEAASKLVGEEPVDGQVCHVIELRPSREDMNYRRIVVWMDRDRLTPRKMQFFDSKDAHTKTLTLDEVRDVGSIPTPHRLTMETVVEGSHTVVSVASVVYDSGLADDLFTQRQLERGAD